MTLKFTQVCRMNVIFAFNSFVSRFYFHKVRIEWRIVGNVNDTSKYKIPPSRVCRCRVVTVACYYVICFCNSHKMTGLWFSSFVTLSSDWQTAEVVIETLPLPNMRNGGFKGTQMTSYDDTRIFMSFNRRALRKGGANQNPIVSYRLTFSSLSLFGQQAKHLWIGAIVVSN